LNTNVSSVLTDTGTTLPGVLGTPSVDLATDIAANLTAINALNDLDAAGVATAVWNAATATYGSAGSYGLLIETNLDAAIGSLNDIAAADVWAVATRTLTASTNFNDISASDVWAAATRTLTANTNLNDLDAAGVRTAVGLASANLDTQLAALPTAAENATAVLTTQLTEGYASDGTAPTLTQAIFQTMQFLHESSVSGTTVTIKGLDGSTSKMTFTLDDATTPTSITRAS
jgi:hypothetical protein